MLNKKIVGMIAFVGLHILVSPQAEARYTRLNTEGANTGWGYQAKHNLRCRIERSPRFLGLFGGCGFDISGYGRMASFNLASTQDTANDPQNHCTQEDIEWIRDQGKAMVQLSICADVDERIFNPKPKSLKRSK